MRSFVVFFIALGLFSAIQASPTFPDPDSFYHAKLALIIRDHGIVREFPWLQATILRDAYVDHHFLYHVLLTPFVTVLPPLVGIKVATALFAALAATMMYILLRALKVRSPGAWIALMLTTAPFVYRLSLAKTPGISVFFLLLGFWLMIKASHANSKRQFIIHNSLFFILNFAYVWLYSAWPFLLVLTVIWCGINVILRAKPEGSRPPRRDESRLGTNVRARIREGFFAPLRMTIVSGIAGIASGLIFNPYFPENIQFAWWQIGRIGLTGGLARGTVIEWLPFAPGELVSSAFPLTVAFLASLAWFIYVVARLGGSTAGLKMVVRERDRIAVWMTAAVMSAFLLAATLQARRNIEYLAPFATAAAALSVTLWGKAFKLRARMMSPAVICALWAILTAAAVTVSRNYTVTIAQFKGGIHPQSFEATASWLATHTPQRATVLLPSFDRFPMFFYFNDHNYYLDGLHPLFTSLLNPERARRLASARAGSEEDPYAVIKDFGASYIVVDEKRKALGMQLIQDHRFKKVYEAGENIVYEVL